jgi:hypothetical protein
MSSASSVALSTPTAESSVRPKDGNVSMAAMSPPAAPLPVLEAMASAP